MRSKHWMGMAVVAVFAMSSYAWAAPQGLGSGYGYTHIARKGSAQVSKAELQRQAEVRRMSAPKAAPKKVAVRKNRSHKRMGMVAPAGKHGKAKKMGALKGKKAKNAKKGKKGKKVKQAKGRSNKGGAVRGKDRAGEVSDLNEEVRDSR